MALNLSNLKIRSLSAIIYILIFLGSLFISNWSFLIFCLFINIGCWLEFQKLSILIEPKLKSSSKFHNIGIIISGSAFILFLTGESLTFSVISIGELGWWCLLISVLILPIIDILFTENYYTQKFLFDVFGFLYLSVSIALLFQLNLINSEKQLPSNIIILTLIFAIWINDSMAYIGGSIFGKTPFFPNISPKKTWEGTLIGFFLSAIIGVVISKIFFKDYIFLISCITIISSIIGTIGDILESKFKRLANVKDSGNIMPGHGGFLDRFDSILLATPIVWLFIFIYFKFN